ncbi:MAG: YqzM family protein [Bacillaceae bacterium]|nr:YqzM family protein [Bacillaceae bacterium]
MTEAQHPEHRENKQVDYIEPIEAGKAFGVSFGFFLLITVLFTVVEVLAR